MQTTDRSFAQAEALLKNRALKTSIGRILDKVSSNRLIYRMMSKFSYTPRSSEDLIPVLAPLVSRFGENLEGIKGKRILCLAGGYGEIASFLNANFEAQAVVLDADRYNIKTGMRTKLHKGVRGRAEALPFKQNSFDIVLSSHFLLAMYVRIQGKEPAMFDEVARVLKSDGILVIAHISNPDDVAGGLKKQQQSSQWKVILSCAHPGIQDFGLSRYTASFALAKAD
jgi:SAM-dependent methyltransferase